MMVIIPEVGYGAGRHKEYISRPDYIVQGLHLNFITQPLCLVAMLFTKVSVGVFLLRLTPSAAYRRVIWGIMIFTVFSVFGNLRG